RGSRPFPLLRTTIWFDAGVGATRFPDAIPLATPGCRLGGGRRRGPDRCATRHVLFRDRHQVAVAGWIPGHCRSDRGSHERGNRAPGTTVQAGGNTGHIDWMAMIVLVFLAVWGLCEAGSYAVPPLRPRRWQLRLHLFLFSLLVA